jgi:VanZ family protein
MLGHRSPKARLFQALTILWIGVIFAFSLQDGLASSRTSGYLSSTLQTLLAYLNLYPEPVLIAWFIRKSAHLIEYFILGSLALQAAPLFKRIPFYAVVFLVPLLDETLQHFVPGRAGTLDDVAIDVIGLILAYGVWRWLGKTKQNL